MVSGAQTGKKEISGERPEPKKTGWSPKSLLGLHFGYMELVETEDGKGYPSTGVIQSWSHFEAYGKDEFAVIVTDTLSQMRGMRTQEKTEQNGSDVAVTKSGVVTNWITIPT